MQKELITKRPVAAIGEEVGFELGAQLVKNYQEANPNDKQFLTIGRNIIEQILAQPGVEGIRFYNAIDEQGEKTLVYLGVDANGKAVKEYSLINNEGTIETRPAIVADRAGKGHWWEILIFW